MSLKLFFRNLFTKNGSKDPSTKIVFDHYFFDLKYFLNPDVSEEEFSRLLNISHQQLDKISIIYYGSSFQTLLNECRYRHFMQELESPINSNLTIESIIKLSGFETNDLFVNFVKSKEDSVIPDTELLANIFEKPS